MNTATFPGIALSAMREACAPFHPVVWMGGDRPGAYSATNANEKRLCTVFFRMYCADYFSGWNECPTIEVARVFWKRARHDAHATMHPPYTTR